MEITRKIHEGHATLALAGRFDATWSEEVAGVLDECIRAGAHVVRLDLAEVVFLSSAGIRVLLASYRDLSRLGGSLAVTCASEPVHTVLQMSGLSALLQLEPAEPARPSPPSPNGETPDRHFEHDGVRIDQWDLDRSATMRVRTVGDPATVLEGSAGHVFPRRLAFPKSAFGVGVAAFGSDADDCAGRYGEFLAVGGAAICHANADGALPDWVVAEGRMIPEAEMLWGLTGDGAFAAQLRFEATESESGVLRLSHLLGLALDAAASDAVAVVMVAETSQLVGAALRKMDAPRGPAASMFAFPAIRDRLLFTAEPAWTDALALVVGVVARQAPTAVEPLLRPVVQDASLRGHLHAAAFPYRPLRKGRAALDATLASLFEDQSVRALLHLVHDWRDLVGAGESAFTRGIVWVSPLEAA